MGEENAHVAGLRANVLALEKQLRALKAELATAEEAHIVRLVELSTQDSAQGAAHETINDGDQVHSTAKGQWPLTGGEFQRYGRAMIMREVGLSGQLSLKNAKVLIVGLGGLGCPAAAYLAGAGVGTLGLIDGDVVEVSNLHRQVAHTTDRIGMHKVESAKTYLEALNPLVRYQCYPVHLTPEMAIKTFEQYDLVLDCTDHPTSRYLISDACVLTGRPLVSAAALKSDGQLIVLNHPARPPGDPLGGPCYRCIFPKPPPAETIVSCGEGGVLGPVVGAMGVLQALEAIKVLTKQTVPVEGAPRATLLLFAAFSQPQFRSLRMRARSATCAACSASATVQRSSLESGSFDYLTFCGMTSPLKLLSPEYRIRTQDFAQLCKQGKVSLIDVRDETQFGICALPDSTNIPWNGRPDAWLTKAKDSGLLNNESPECFIICRYGNDSQLAVRRVLEESDLHVKIRDVAGGFKSWREEVDESWPAY